MLSGKCRILVSKAPTQPSRATALKVKTIAQSFLRAITIFWFKLATTHCLVDVMTAYTDSATISINLHFALATWKRLAESLITNPTTEGLGLGKLSVIGCRRFIDF